MARCNRYFRGAGIWVVLYSSFLILFSACGSNITTGGGDNHQPTKTPSQAAPLTLDFKCRENPAGGFYVNAVQGRVCVQTAPGAALTITVRFCNGAPDPSAELKGTVYADSSGYYEWSWNPRPDCAGPHIWKGDAVVNARLDGQSITSKASFFGD